MAILSIPDYFKVENRKMRWMLYTLFCLMVADGLLTKFLVINGYWDRGEPIHTILGEPGIVFSPEDIRRVPGDVISMD